MNWRDQQTMFAEAVRNPDLGVPLAVGPRLSAPPFKRFNVYRNNSAVSLTDAIADSFPVVGELVGEEFFTGMARAYVAAHLPSSPVLMNYGGTFANFIENFEPAKSLPFLPDVARVEWAWAQSYHAADRASVDVSALQRMEPDDLNNVCLELHPSVRMICSDWPAVSLWSAHQLDDPDQRQKALSAIAQQGEYGLIVRPEFDVAVHSVEAPITQMLKLFQEGRSLAEAVERLNADDAANFGGMLGYIFSTGAVVAVRNDR